MKVSNICGWDDKYFIVCSKRNLNLFCFMKNLLIIVLFFLSIKIYGIHPYNSLSVDNGLMHTDATCFSQDNAGLLWIGTNNGLHLFDGYSLKQYEYQTKGRVYMQYNKVQGIVRKDSLLWIGTKSGLLCFNTIKRQYVDYKSNNLNLEVLNRNINNLQIDLNGNIWIKTRSSLYVAKIIGETLSFYQWKDSVDKRLCGTFEKSAPMYPNRNHMWVKEDDNLICLEVKDNYIFLDSIYKISDLIGEKSNNFVINDDFLYLRTISGCYRFELCDNILSVESLKYVSFVELDKDLLSNTLGIFTVDKKGTLYNSYYGGVFSVKNAFSETPELEYFRENNLFRIKEGLTIKDLLVDSFDNLWVATINWGVKCYSISESIFNSFSLDDINSRNNFNLSVSAIEEANSNSIWVLTDSGVLIKYDLFKRKGEEVYKFPKNFKCQILKRSSDKKSLYIGNSKGVYKFNIDNREIIHVLKNISVTGIEELGNNKFIISTYGNGVIVVQEENTDINKSVWYIESQYTSKTTPHLSSDLVLDCIFNYRTNELFCGTENGLNRIFINHGKIKKILSYMTSKKDETSMSSDYITDIEIENDTVVWIGTIGGGVNRIHFISDSENDYVAEVYTKNNDLTSNDAEIIHLDSYNRLWVGGTGICCIDRKNKSVSIFGPADGVLKHPIKMGAGCKMKNGTICMGGLSGLNTFIPENYINVYNRHKPELILTCVEFNTDNYVSSPKEINVFDKKIIELSYKENSFKLFFTVSGFKIFNNIIYRYRIKEFSKAWTLLSYKNNNVPFINLPDGKYNIELEISYDNGKSWNKESRKELQIIILPPWWKTLHLKILYVISFLIIIVLLINFIIKFIRLKKENITQQIEKKHSEELYQAKQQFFINVSHEFKTPLTLISLAAEQISINNPSKECDSIKKNTTHLSSLISEMMELRKGELGINSYNFIHGDILPVVNDIIREVSPWIIEKSIILDFIASDKQIYMDFNNKGIIKIVLNLLSNAIKYSGRNKKITIETYYGYIEEIRPYYDNVYSVGKINKGDKCWLFRIKDEGIGILKTSINKIYDSFFQVNDTENKNIGSGIGLAIVKNAVIAHNGKIIVSSKKGDGTEFIVALPLKQERDKVIITDKKILDNSFIKQLSDTLYDNEIGVSDDDIILENSEKPLILLIEDNKELLDVMKSLLSVRFKIITAINGKEGLKKALELYPDLIVSDVMMPEMNGVELCKEIRSNIFSAYIPIILLSAKSEVEHQIYGYESGADLYLPKPFSAKLLEVTISRLLVLKSLTLKNSSETFSENIDKHVSDNRENMKKNAQKDFLEKLYRIVNDNIQDSELSADFIAASMGMSRSKLYLQVKETTDITLSEYIRNKRLEKAASLLQTTTMNITEVMYETGFVNLSHFSKLFKQKYDVSPSNFIKRCN